MFTGVNYEVNVANEPGSRIRNLIWPDGTPVADEDEFVIAVNNYRATSHLLVPGAIYEEGDLPTLLETDVRGEIGGIRELIGDYIVNVKDGTITPRVRQQLAHHRQRLGRGPAREGRRADQRGHPDRAGLDGRQNAERPVHHGGCAERDAGRDFRCRLSPFTI